MHLVFEAGGSWYEVNITRLRYASPRIIFARWFQLSQELCHYAFNFTRIPEFRWFLLANTATESRTRAKNTVLINTNSKHIYLHSDFEHIVKLSQCRPMLPGIPHIAPMLDQDTRETNISFTKFSKPAYNSAYNLPQLQSFDPRLPSLW